MQRGETVIVKALGDTRLERVVLEIHDTYVLVCRREIYEESIASGIQPSQTMGFPKEDVAPTGVRYESFRAQRTQSGPT